MLLPGSFVFLVGTLPTDLLIGAHYFAYDSLEKHARIGYFSRNRWVIPLRGSGVSCCLSTGFGVVQAAVVADKSL